MKSINLILLFLLYLFSASCKRDIPEILRSQIHGVWAPIGYTDSMRIMHDRKIVASYYDDSIECVYVDLHYIVPGEQRYLEEISVNMVNIDDLEDEELKYNKSRVQCIDYSCSDTIVVVENILSHGSFVQKSINFFLNDNGYLVSKSINEVGNVKYIKYDNSRLLYGIMDKNECVLKEKIMTCIFGNQSTWNFNLLPNEMWYSDRFENDVETFVVDSLLRDVKDVDIYEIKLGGKTFENKVSKKLMYNVFSYTIPLYSQDSIWLNYDWGLDQKALGKPYFKEWEDDTLYLTSQNNDSACRFMIVFNKKTR